MKVQVIWKYSVPNSPETLENVQVKLVISGLFFFHLSKMVYFWPRTLPQWMFSPWRRYVKQDLMPLLSVASLSFA